MRIAIFTDTYVPEINGIVTSVKNFSELLADKGHEILIFCPRYIGSNKTEKHQNIRILRFPAFSFITNKATRISFPSLSEVIAELKYFQPDVIHIQTPMNIGLTGLWASKILDIKNIQTYHTYIPDFMVYLKPKNILGLSRISEELKNSIIFERAIESDLVEGIGRARKEFFGDVKSFGKYIGLKRKKKDDQRSLTNIFAWNFTRFLYNRADLVLTPSEALKQELVKHGINTLVEVQSNGVELSEFKVKTDYKAKNKILHIGRLGPEKNVDVLLKAFAKVKDCDVVFDIMGDGPSKKDLMKLATKLKISDKVNFLGYVDRKLILNTLKDYDLFLTASTIETQGLVILEAMASGLPVVGVNKLAIPEVVKDGENGFVVKPGDFSEMAKKIQLILENENLRMKMGQNALDIVREHDLNLMTDKLESYYRQIVREEILV